MSTPNSFQKLRSLQSTRTSFTLSDEANELLEAISKAYDITQKEAFSLIMSDDELLNTIVNKLQKNDFNVPEEKNQRTKVISKGALSKLNDLSKSEKLSRDMVLEIALREFKEHLKNYYESYKKAQELIEKGYGFIEDIDGELRRFLSDDDPILETWGAAVVNAMNASTAIGEKLKEAEPNNEDVSPNT